MGRAPCCEKMGLKRGPWTPEEDLILINYINTHGHNNWRALPKQAGLLRCGKSCRLRWINYLRPDIKRGNFTIEEEDTIIKLHEMMGNRWSAIAARLPGRTDNEIKNVWHTHLKKRHQQDTAKPFPKQILLFHTKNSNNQDEPVNPNTYNNVNIKIERTEEEIPLSPPQCSTSDDISTLTTSTINQDLSSMNNNNDNNNFSVDKSINGGDNLALDEDFWSEVLSSDNSNFEARNFQDIIISDGELKFQFPFSSLVSEERVHFATSSSSLSDGMEFWYDVYTNAEEME